MTETKITVAELIEKLKEFDGDMRVIFACEKTRQWSAISDAKMEYMNLGSGYRFDKVVIIF